MKKLFCTIACVAFFICCSTVSAQDANREMPRRPEKGFKPVPLSPVESAQRTTDRMNSLLNLTEKQYDKIFKLNLKWAREDAEQKAEPPRMGERPEGMPDFDFEGNGNFGGGFGQPPFGGGFQPGGMDRRMMPRDFSPADDKERMEKQRKKRDKKLKKVLTDEQYNRWVTLRNSAANEKNIK